MSSIPNYINNEQTYEPAYFAIAFSLVHLYGDRDALFVRIDRSGVDSAQIAL